MRPKKVLVFLSVLAAAATIGGCEKSSQPPRSSNDDPPAFSSVAHGARGSLSSLGVESMETFLSDAAASPQEKADQIRTEIARVAKDPKLISALATQLLATPVVNVERHLMLLSTLGETRNPQAINALSQFIWNKQLLAPPPNPNTGQRHGSTVFNHDVALRARAAEMLAYIGTEEAKAATLEVAAKHPNLEVRLAAIDAYLFNNNDSTEAKEKLSGVVQESERKLIGLPRWKKGMDRADFDRRLLEFYTQHPEERPASPSAENLRSATEPLSVKPRGAP
jgi:hypothetical protein